MNLAALWDQLVDAVCRPPRDDAYTEADLVGGRRASFRLYDRKYYRQDVQLTNSRGQKLQGSHYRPCVTISADGRLPVVIYCHCNSGSRRDAEEILFHLLPKGITVFAVDFAGSGLSEGSYVTLGALEVDDLAAVVKYLREEGSSSTIGLWGRSMGAVTALLYSQQDPSVAGMVLDSPFSRLVDLMLELATDQQLRIPKPLIKVALAMLKRSVKKRAGFSVDRVAPLDCVGASFIPALFAHGKDDTFVAPHHSERLFQAYAGDKNFVTFEGEHNSVRPAFFYDSALIFLVQALRVDELVGPGVDLAALPASQLPHLSPRANSIYVTAARATSEEGNEQEGSGLASRTSGGSPRSGSASPGSSLSRAESSASRQLNVPWALPGGVSRRRGGAAIAGPAQPAGSAGSQQLQQQQSGQEAANQLAALLGVGTLGDGRVGGEEALLAAADLSEDEALQRALELSLQEACQQQQQAGAEPERTAGAGGAPAEQQAQHARQADEQLPMHLRYNAAFSASGGEGGRNPLYSRQSVAGVPATADEEDAMLAAALAASLQDAENTQQHAAAAARVQPAAAGGAGAPASSDAAELAHYYGISGSPASVFTLESDEGNGEEERQAGTGGRAISQVAAPEIPAERASGAAPQAVVDKHSGQEAAAVRQASLRLGRALAEAAGGAQVAGEAPLAHGSRHSSGSGA